jgi:hypothetical protein
MVINKELKGMLHNLLAFLNVVLPLFIASIFFFNFQVLHVSTSQSHSLLVLYKSFEAYVRGFYLGGMFSWLVLGYWSNVIPFHFL